MTPEELAYHLRECQAPPGFCPVCDTAKATRHATLEEAAKKCESLVLTYPIAMPQDCAASIRALKKDDRDE